MTKTTLVIINEPVEKMILGTNTSLAYILACLDLGWEVAIHNLPSVGEIFPTNLQAKISVLFLSPKENPKLCEAMVATYKRRNREISDSVKSQEFVEKFLSEDLKKNLTRLINLQDVENVIQRLEPMKAPFPPAGEKNIDEVLGKIKTTFSHLKFNCPIGLGDKEIPQEINRIFLAKNEEPISTPTHEFRLDDASCDQQFSAMRKEYRKIYPEKNSEKIVIKPKNSAQSLGVFALDFVDGGLDLPSLKKCNFSDFWHTQTYQINSKISGSDLLKMVQIFCFLQNANARQGIIGAISEQEIFSTAHKLYNEQIIVQPFLEGIKLGDVRANFLKDEKENFYCAGYSFRKSIRQKDDKNFTTAFVGGGSHAWPIAALQEDEQKELFVKTESLLHLLNQGELKEKYQNSTELGIDFILAGNGKKLFLGEINHHCPGLLPVSEAMAPNSKNYDSGLGFAKAAILANLF